MDANRPSTFEKAHGRWLALSPRGRFLAIAAVLAVAAVAWFVLRDLGTAPRNTPTPPVIVAQAVRRDVVVREPVVGKVLADATVNVTARVGGQIVGIDFQEGQDVAKGDVLFRLDPRPLAAAVRAAEAALARDSASFESARRDAARSKALAAQNAISAQALEAAMAAAKAAEATVMADKAALETARLNLDYATIRAPIDGKTGAINVQIGNLVVANASAVLVSVTRDRPVKVSFFLSQDKLAKVQDQMRAGRLTAEVTVEGSNIRLAAPVDFVGNAVSETTGTIELRAHFPNAERRLVPGQQVTVAVMLETLHRATVVPRNAVNQGPNADYVFVVRQGKVKQVPVRVRYETPDIAAVEGAVKPGDIVVTDGQLRISDGDSVRIAGRGAGRTALSSPGAQ